MNLYNMWVSLFKIKSCLGYRHRKHFAPGLNYSDLKTLGVSLLFLYMQWKSINPSVCSSQEAEGTLPYLLVLCGDHGMSETGSHGGSSEPEVSTPLVLISPAFKRKGKLLVHLSTPFATLCQHRLMNKSVGVWVFFFCFFLIFGVLLHWPAAENAVYSWQIIINLITVWNKLIL